MLKFLKSGHGLCSRKLTPLGRDDRSNTTLISRQHGSRTRASVLCVPQPPLARENKTYYYNLLVQMTATHINYGIPSPGPSAGAVG